MTPPEQTAPVRDHLHLNFVLRPHGSHPAAWRVTKTPASALTTLGYYADLARSAERGLFDTLFLTDTLRHSALPDEALQWPLEPVQLMSALAGQTRHIGLIATHSTSFNLPYNTARAFSTLDHLSGGRAGWNVVTSSGDDTARNFGAEELTEHDERYRRAADYLNATLALWHGWDAAAVVEDRAGGRLVDPARVAQVNYQGSDYAVKGPLGAPASPQLVPILSQAGSSPTGRDLAARYADVVYAFHNGLDDARAYRADLHARARAIGRDPATLRFLPGIVPYVAATEAKARAIRRDLAAASDPAQLLGQARALFGLEFDAADLSRPVDWVRIEANRPGWPDPARIERMAEHHRDAAPTSLLDLLAGTDFRFQHKALVGTPDQIADYIEQGWRTGAFDGVSVIPAILPEGLDAFVDQVVPVLQRRGLHKTAYGSGPLRQRLGLRQWQVDRTAFTPHYTA